MHVGSVDGCLWMTQSSPEFHVSASAVTDPVEVDSHELRTLATRMRSIADDIAGEAIPAPALGGSATSMVNAPGKFAAEARRLSAAVNEWARNAVRCADELAAADNAGGDIQSR